MTLPKIPTSLKFGLVALVTLSGCIATTFPYMRDETAQRIAAPAWMIKRDIAAETYTLRAYERIHNRNGVANLYIEGDGPAYTSRGEWLLNPTPKNPVALHLASKDRADNVIYLGQPCQYIEEDACSGKPWKNGQYTPEAMAAFNAALNDISRRYGISGFNLIGYSGGGAIAAILANRDDVLSLRTVSGILDTDVHAQMAGTTAAVNTLNPVLEITEDHAYIPQRHFIGGQDAVVPPAVFNSYAQSLPASDCIQHTIIQEAEYQAGWVDKWPELLAMSINCRTSKPIAFDLPQDTLPVMETPDFGAKGKRAAKP